jgi:hypothetical protein
MSEERTETPDGQVKLLQQPGSRPLGGSGTQGRAETGKRIPVLVVRSREWTLWVLAGLTYLGYVAMAAMEAPTLPVAVGLALLPLLRLLPERTLVGVGIGTGWFVGGLFEAVSAYTLFALILASGMLALAAGRVERWGWLIGVVAGYVAGIWWEVSR